MSENQANSNNSVNESSQPVRVRPKQLIMAEMGLVYSPPVPVSSSSVFVWPSSDPPYNQNNFVDLTLDDSDDSHADDAEDDSYDISEDISEDQPDERIFVPGKFFSPFEGEIDHTDREDNIAYVGLDGYVPEIDDSDDTLCVEYTNA